MGGRATGDGGSCASCARVLPDRARFCPACGAATATGPQPEVAGERRQVTVLFADLVDSTLVSQQVDPEELAEAVLAYQETGRRVITGLGGHVANYLGDGLLGLFGYPGAHEDDALRAVRAGRALLDELEGLQRRFPVVTLAARVGIHTGLVVVGAMGSGDRTDTSAFGDATNIAARVEGSAAPGTISLSAVTLARVRPHVDVEDLGPHHLKGVIEPVELYRVRALVDLEDRGGGDPSPFLGRRRELDRLREVWAEVEDGGCRALVVRADAGLGKSRLVGELYDELAATGATRLRGTCSPLAVNTAYQPFVAMIERAAGVTAATDPHTRARALTDLLARWEVDDAALRSLLGLGAGGDQATTHPETFRFSTQAALRGWVDRVLAHGPTIVFVDDLHWADPSTRDLLDHLATEHHPGLLVVTTLRPEVGAAPPEGEAVEVLDLGPLSAEDSRLLACAVGGDALPEAVLTTVITRTDGIPLFIEELTRAVRADPEVAVPATLHDSLMARLDALGPARRVAQVASVLGRDFTRDLLASTADDHDLDDHLAQLRDAGVVEPVARAHDTFTFRHALIQDAAYESLLRRDRRRLHGRVAAALRAGARDTVPEQVAHHLAGAGDHLAAARWYDRAGRRAAAQGAYLEALGHLHRGLEVLPAADEGLERDRVELGLQIMVGNSAQSVQGFGTPANEPVWARARELARRVGDLDEMTSAMNGTFTMHFDQGECVRARDLACAIVEVAEAGDSRAGRVRGHCSVGLSSLYLGEPGTAREHARRAVGEYRLSDYHELTYGIGSDQGVVAHGTWGLAAWFLGLDDEARGHLAVAVDLGRRLDSLISTSVGLIFATAGHLMRREHVRAAALAHELESIGVALDATQPRGLGRVMGGAARAHLGRPGAADDLAEGTSMLAAAGGQGGAPIAMAIMADAHLSLGDTDAAAALAEVGLAVAEAGQQPFVDSDLLRIRALAGRAGTASDDDVAADLAAAVAAARDIGSFALELRAALAAARHLPGAAPRAALAAVVDRAPPSASSPDLDEACALLHPPPRPPTREGATP